MTIIAIFFIVLLFFRFILLFLDETVDHLIFECELTSDNDMKQKLRNIGYHPPWCIRDIVACEINKSEKDAMKIISSTLANKLLENRNI